MVIRPIEESGKLEQYNEFHTINDTEIHVDLFFFFFFSNLCRSSVSLL